MTRWYIVAGHSRYLNARNAEAIELEADRLLASVREFTDSPSKAYRSSSPTTRTSKKPESTRSKASRGKVALMDLNVSTSGAKAEVCVAHWVCVVCTIVQF